MSASPSDGEHLPPAALVWPKPLPDIAHASAAAFGRAGVLVIGPSGSGKTSLVFRLISLGADYVSDDLTQLDGAGPEVLLSRPKTKRPPQIEARGIGILPAHVTEHQVRLELVIDLGMTETRRLPPRKLTAFGAVHIQTLHKIDNIAFPDMIRHLLTT